MSSNLIADFRPKITSSWVLHRFMAPANHCSSAGFWHEGLHPRADSTGKSVQKDPGILKPACTRTAFSCPWWHKPSWAHSLAFMQIVVSFKCVHPGRSSLLFSCTMLSVTGSKSKQFAPNTGLLTGVAVLCKCRILGDGTISTQTYLLHRTETCTLALGSRLEPQIKLVLIS